jgi:D-serine deaminase-like pyridoxal phosphate-dependent protein
MKDLYTLYTQAMADIKSPALFLDTKALEKNIQWVVENCGKKSIRIATKSVRSLDVLKKITASNPVFQGIMTYTLEEALWLREEGFDDILMGYPTWDKKSLEILADKPAGIVLMVDRIEHLDLLEEVAKSKFSTFEICLDLDLSMDLPKVRFGVYRSSLQDEKSLKAFLHHLQKCPRLKVVGAMGYEAQIAGVMDEKSRLIKTLKKMSLLQLAHRRKKLVQLIRSAGHDLRLINGGGTGSLKQTMKEEVVTEVTVGSAFYAPVLFDHYEDFKLTPALFFTAPIVRQPTQDIFTLLGAGYMASGATEEIKQPQPYLPKGVTLLKHEGAGEVHTRKIQRRNKAKNW